MADEFPERVKELAFSIAGHYCQCTMAGCGHHGRCGIALTRATAEFHHRTSIRSGGESTLGNCEVLCSDCHRATASYGRH